MEELAQYFEAVVKEKNAEFTKAEKKIANFFLEKYSEIPFLSIHDLADQLQVGRATILRFSKKIGFDGFLALKREIKSKLQITLAPMERFRNVLETDKTENTLIAEVAENEVANINSVLNSYNSESLKKAVELIIKSNFVFTVGCDLSSYLAGITSYLFQRIGVKSHSANVGGRSLVEQLFTIERNDLLIAFSLPPYSYQTIEAAKYAKEQGAKIIGFTNTLTAPLVQYSDVVLQIKSNSSIFANSLSSILVVIYTLVYEAALKDKTRSKEAIDERIAKRG